MSKRGKEFTSNFLAKSPQFSYLEDRDKFLFAPEKPKYKFNVIGVGMMGQEHIRMIMMEGRAIVHGIYDTNAKSIETTKGMMALHFPGHVPVVYNSLKDACNDPDVDGLIICTPNYTHLEIVEEAAKSEKHIMLEKPMATTLADAEKIAQIAKDYKAVFQIGLQYRYKAIYVEAIHEAIERKSIGEIYTISISEHRVPFLDKVNQWNKFSRYSGGTLVEKCCHYFDLLNLFAGSRPKQVYASGSMAVNFKDFEYNGQKSDIIDNAIVVIDYENGVRANFNLCMFAPMFYEEIVICGDEGRIKANENEDFLPSARPKVHLEVMRGEKKPSKITTPTYPTYIEEGGHNGATYYEHIYFVDNIEGKKTSTATVDEGFWSIVVGAAAEESVKTGTVVKIDELLEKNKIKR